MKTVKRSDATLSLLDVIIGTYIKRRIVSSFAFDGVSIQRVLTSWRNSLAVTKVASKSFSLPVINDS